MSVSSWEELTEQLADRLPRLAVDDVVILEASGNRFTEVIQLEGQLSLSAVANPALPQDAQLSPDQEQELEKKGWQPPNGPLRQTWWLEVRKWPLHSRDAARIADLMVSTLRDVYGVASPSDIEQRAFRS